MDGEPIVEKRLTANGEVEEIVNSRRVPARMARRVALEFACDSDELLTGLGQHEDGVYQYQGKKEYLYQNNMIISLPFLLSSAGYGVLIDAECAMRFESDEPGKFRFIPEAVEDFGLTVLRGRDAAEVVRMLSAQNGATPLLPRWAYGYMQSRERYKTAEELEETVRRFRRENLGLDCIILDWRTWQGNRWGDKTPDPERFPSVPAMMDALHALHAHLIVSVWPNMAKGGQDHAEFEAAHQFLPNCDTYDAFNPDARRLYAEQCERFWGSGGVDGFWCDSSEPFTDPDWNGAQKRPEGTRYRLINDAAARVLSRVMRKYNSVTYEVGKAKAEQAAGMFGLAAGQRAASCPSRVAKPLAKPLTGGWRSATYARSQQSAPCFSRSICSSGYCQELCANTTASLMKLVRRRPNRPRACSAWLPVSGPPVVRQGWRSHLRSP